MESEASLSPEGLGNIAGSFVAKPFVMDELKSQRVNNPDMKVHIGIVKSFSISPEGDELYGILYEDDGDAETTDKS